MALNRALLAELLATEEHVTNVLHDIREQITIALLDAEEGEELQVAQAVAGKLTQQGRLH